MKKILIISEKDLTSVKLTALYHTLYGQTTKELIVCNLELSECYIGGMHPYKKPRTQLIKNAPNPFRNYIVHSKPKKIMAVKNCKEIIDLIKKEKITTVLVPNFLYDNDRTNQFNSIVKEVKRIGNVEVIGVYV